MARDDQFQLTGNDIIKAAARKINAVRSGAQMGTAMIADFRQSLNAMVKHWEAQGLHLWTVGEATLFPQPGQVQYRLSNAASSAHATESFVQTEISAAEASGQTVISVETTDGMANDNYIGVTLDDGSIFWSKVVGAPGATVTISSPLPDSTAAGNLVFAYANKIVRPLHIPFGRSYDPISAEETTVDPIARRDYQMLSNKIVPGQINQFYYDPQLSAGLLNLYQTQSIAGSLFKFTWHRPILKFDAAGDYPDLPEEWSQTLIFNLAVVMAPEFSVSTETLQQIATMAGTFKDDMMGWDREAESFQFGPDFEQG